MVVGWWLMVDGWWLLKFSSCSSYEIPLLMTCWYQVSCLPSLSCKCRCVGCLAFITRLRGAAALIRQVPVPVSRKGEKRGGKEEKVQPHGGGGEGYPGQTSVIIARSVPLSSRCPWSVYPCFTPLSSFSATTGAQESARPQPCITAGGLSKGRCRAWEGGMTRVGRRGSQGVEAKGSTHAAASHLIFVI